jgi:hypothetical protein
MQAMLIVSAGVALLIGVVAFVCWLSIKIEG